MPLFYKGKQHKTYLSHIKEQITASRKNIYLVIVYVITEYPMILATNKEIKRGYYENRKAILLQMAYRGILQL